MMKTMNVWHLFLHMISPSFGMPSADVASSWGHHLAPHEVLKVTRFSHDPRHLGPWMRVKEKTQTKITSSPDSSAQKKRKEKTSKKCPS